MLCNSAGIDFDAMLAGDLLGEGALDGDVAVLSLLARRGSLVQACLVATVRRLVGRALERFRILQGRDIQDLEIGAEALLMGASDLTLSLRVLGVRARSVAGLAGISVNSTVLILCR